MPDLDGDEDGKGKTVAGEAQAEKIEAESNVATDPVPEATGGTDASATPPASKIQELSS